MFFKKDNFAETQALALEIKKRLQEKQSKQALEVIEEELAELQSKYEAGYVRGLVEMAYILEAIEREARNDYIDKIHAKERAEAAKGQPIYKKKGVYEYREHLITKAFELEKTTNECWCAIRKADNAVIAMNVSFKEAVYRINESIEG